MSSSRAAPAFRRRPVSAACARWKGRAAFSVTTRRSIPESLGFGVTVFANVGLHSQAEADLTAFETLIESWPEVRECHMLAGETDFLLRIVATDWDAYQRFLTTRLTAAPNVSVVKSALAVRSSKNAPGVPIAIDEPA